MLEPLIITKDKLLTVTETTTLAEALEVLEKASLRCVPILDQTGTLFRGNIYKFHLYKHLSKGGDMQLPVTYLLKNATKFIFIDDPFFRVFFTLRDLPYIAVINKEHQFHGILTHEKMLETLANSWHLDQANYLLTICSTDEKGSLATMLKIISKYSNIVNSLSFDAQAQKNERHSMITLPREISEENLEKLITNLEKKGFQVLGIQKLINK